MHRKDTLVVFTNGYPYCAESERTFMRPEIEAAAGAFKRVVIVPMAKLGVSADDGFPANVEVAKFQLESVWGRYRWMRAFRLFLPTTWWRARGDISRSGLTFAARAGAVAGALKRWMRREGLNEDNALWYTFWFDIAAAALTVAGIKYRSSAHGFDIYTRRGGELRRRMLEKAGRVYAASESGAAYLRKEYPEFADKVGVRRLGCVRLYNAPSEHHSAAERAITILSVSNVIPQKRVDLNLRLVEALAKARPGSAVRWIHVGDGQEMKRVMELAASPLLPRNLICELRGNMSNEDVQKLYVEEKIDWFMLLSTREGGNSIAVCEAMSYGVPLIVTDTTGLADMARDEFALLLPVDVAAEEFVRGILPYIESDTRVEAMREASLREWEDKYDASKLRREFIASL